MYIIEDGRRLTQEEFEQFLEDSKPVALQEEILDVILEEEVLNG